MIKDKQRGVMYGLAVSDSLGAAVEFQYPGEFEPVTGYRGGGPHGIDAGCWTDDTSMALALADAIANSESFPPNKQIQLENYLNWFQNGKYSVNDFCFDIGTTTRHALMKFERDGDLTSDDDDLNSGNGSIMRLAPIPIKYYNLSTKDLVLVARESSETTHAAEKCMSACAYMAVVLAALINGKTKEEVLDPEFTKDLELHPAIRRVADGSYKENTIRGSGYVVQSLEAALWAFWKHSNFEDTVLAAVNLGEDADTTGAVAGQFAGALYGFSGIPQHLIDGLVRKEMIEKYLNPLINNL